MSVIKNILIFITIAAALVLVYIFFIKPDKKETSNLVSVTGTPLLQNSNAAPKASGGTVAKDFLTLLLSVDNIKLNDSIFSEKAFANLDGSHSILLIPDGNEGRINPFAPLGSDVTSQGAPSNASGNAGGAAGVR